MVEYTGGRPVAGIALNAPERSNSLDGETLAALIEAVDRAEADPEVRMVVLRSAVEGIFCVGMDFSHFMESRGGGNATGNAGAAERGAELYARTLKRISGISKTTVALVRGECRAGGVGLAAACDGIIADENGSFELSELLFGLLPANVIPYLLRRISPQKTAWLALTLQRVGAERAVDIGLADELFPSDRFEKQCKPLFRNLCRCSPSGTGALKRFVRKMEQSPDPENRIENAVEELARLLDSPDVRSGIAEFRAGSLPAWCVKPGKFEV